MIKRWLYISLLCCLLCPSAKAQIAWPSPEVEQMYNTARTYLSKGGFKEAIAAYQQIIQLAPAVMEPYRDLGQAYYLTGAYENANKTLNSILMSGSADAQSYQIAAASYTAQGDGKKAKSILLDGIKKYPASGMLYHDLGKLYDNENDGETALSYWLTGIENDPGYHINYYEAAQTYLLTDHPVWVVLYGELFINKEPLTPRSADTRKLVLEAYSRIFLKPTNTAAPEFGITKKAAVTSFETAVLSLFRKLSPVMIDGITTENLTMLRTRFIIDWNATYAAQYPFSLFTYHDVMLQNGYFDAYNQWIFGNAENAQQYTNWKKFHPQAIPDLEQWLRQHVLKPVAKDFYNDKKTKGIFPRK